MRGTVTVLAPGQHPAPPQSSLKVRLTRTHGRPALTLVHVQVPAPNAGVLLQLHYPSGTPWRTARRARLNAEGRATLKLAASVKRRLRVVVQAGGPPLIGKSLAPGG
jgi:hypothetical protein